MEFQFFFPQFDTLVIISNSDIWLEHADQTENNGKTCVSLKLRG